MERRVRSVAAMMNREPDWKSVLASGVRQPDSKL